MLENAACIKGYYIKSAWEHPTIYSWLYMRALLRPQEIRVANSGLHLTQWDKNNI